MQGPAGTEIRVRHAEVLEHGELGTRPLRDAQATDRFILSGGDDVFEPTFTFHGFRYAEIDGWPGELTPTTSTAVVVASDLQRTGTFECSDPLLNQFHENVVWGMRGNFLDVPDRLPAARRTAGLDRRHRGFAPTAAFLYDVDAFLADWLRDLDARADATTTASCRSSCPTSLKYVDIPADSRRRDARRSGATPRSGFRGRSSRRTATARCSSASSPRWPRTSASRRAAVADRALGHRLPVRRLARPGRAAGGPGQAKADTGVVATACLYRSLRIVAEAADAARATPTTRPSSRRSRTRIRTAFNEHYVDGDGRSAVDCTTVYALAIVFGLLDDDDEAAAGDRLAELVAESGYRISTGFAGTPFITDALTQTGHLDDAYRLLLERECPSWLYPVTMGATTVWERWDSMLPDGTINPGEMTSFNHYALGAVADWMHRTIGGLAPLEPGYAKVLIARAPAAA